MIRGRPRSRRERARRLARAHPPPRYRASDLLIRFIQEAMARKIGVAVDLDGTIEGAVVKLGERLGYVVRVRRGSWRAE